MTGEDPEVELEPRPARGIGSRDRERSTDPFFTHLRARVPQPIAAIRGVLLGLILLQAPLCALAAEAEPSVVILLSWDGVRHDYPDRASPAALGRMAREGTRADRLIPVFPASTFPNHVALATGAYTATHGIVANRFRDAKRGFYDYAPDASWIQAEPLWVAAERQGVRSAVFFWVGSETDWNGVGATYRRVPFESGVSERSKVDQILAWLDLPRELRPRLILSWWHGCDSVGHRRGPDDPAVQEQLLRQDRELARLMAGLDEREAWARTTLLVVSDHGMAVADRAIDVLGPLRSEGIGAQFISSGGSGYLWLDDPEKTSRGLEILRRLEAVRAYASTDLPDELHGFHPGRTGHIVVLTRPPFRLQRASLLQRVAGKFARKRGGHGYAPDIPEMSAIFYAMGRGVPAGRRLERVRAVDVAPTVARLLGIEPPRDAQGRALQFETAAASLPELSVEGVP